MPVGERVFLGHEPGGERGDLLHQDESRARNFREHVVDVRGRHLIENPRLRRRRRNAVDGDVLPRQFLPERFRQRDDAGLGRAVGRGIRIAFLAGDRRDVDDAAVAAGAHHRHDRPAAQKHAGQVDVEDAPPLVRRILPRRHVRAGDPGARDQDIDAAERADRCGNRRVHLSDVDDVHRRRVHVAERRELAGGGRRASRDRSPTAIRGRPSRSRRSAIARPIPCAPPVITARRPVRSKACISVGLPRDLAGRGSRRGSRSRRRCRPGGRGRRTASRSRWTRGRRRRPRGAARASSSSDTSRWRVRASTSSSMMSPSRTSASGPPTAASGARAARRCRTRCRSSARRRCAPCR